MFSLVLVEGSEILGRVHLSLGPHGSGKMVGKQYQAMVLTLVSSQVIIMCFNSGFVFLL